MDLGQHIADEVLCRDGRLHAFGKELAVGREQSKVDACADLRSTLVRRMEQRLPFAEESHWQRLTRLMNAQLSHGDDVARAKRIAILTVDSM
jgi:hypothetical protein